MMDKKNRCWKRKGFTLVELMVGVVILTVMVAGAYSIMASGQSAWFTTDTTIGLQEDMRVILERMSKEIRESGSDSLSVMQVTINNGGGSGGSDIITFSMPVICEAGGSVMDANGDVANWGAPLTWGCTSSACMDADDDCDTVDYKYVRYLKDDTNNFLRRVLDGGFTTVREDVFAQNVTDFQASLSGDQNVVTVTITASDTTQMNRPVTTTSSLDIFLRNRG